YLTMYLQYSGSDYAMELPAPPPAFNPDAMRDIDAWVKQQGSRLLFIYGEWDPWSAGKFALGSATDSAILVQAQGTHGSTITGLSDTDRATALAKLRAWTGVEPMPLSAPEVEAPPRIPSAILRALRERSSP